MNYAKASILLLALALSGAYAQASDGHADAKTTHSCCAMKSHDASTTDTKKPARGQVVYTCPMHPDVVSDKPGKCPKCGMNLEMKK